MRRCCYRHYLYGLALLLGGVLLTTPLPAEAGGTVTGRVTYVGKVPPAKEFVFKKFPNTDFCKTNPKRSADGTIRLLREVEVMKGRGLKHAIVSLRDVTDTEWTNTYQRTEVVAEKCEWLPFTGVVVNKAGFYVENHDADPSDPKSKKGVLHNPQWVRGARGEVLDPLQRGSPDTRGQCREEAHPAQGEAGFRDAPCYATSMSSCRPGFFRSRTPILRELTKKMGRSKS